MKKTVAAGLGACAIALAFAAKDPVIMKVNGVDVPKSEFEYLYNKNSQQQIATQTLDEYVEMFKLYKMKVADARAEGIDTMASFIKETNQYRRDLAAPYLTDSIFLNKLVNEAHDRALEEVEAYHIMLFKTRDLAQNAVLRQRADSLHALLVNGADFADLADRYSQDRGSKSRGGRMGWIVANNYPVAFEVEAYRLPEGKISEVVESPVGYHILKGGKHRPARGKVQAAHILKLTQDKDSAGQAKALRDIDSLYNVVMANPDSFSAVASANSEDRGSARQGGMLPWFGAGEMVAEFDSVAFSLSNGEISRPFKTAYGYHIIKRLDSKGVPSVEEMKPQLIARITSPQDARYKLVRDNQTRNLAKKHKSSLNSKTLDALRGKVAAEGLDSAFVASYVAVGGAQPLFTIDGKSTSAGEFVKTLSRFDVPASVAVEVLNDNLDAFYNNALVEAEINSLEKTEPDYRNLLKEYVDGSLLYEVSVRKVWDRAAKDTEGLKAFFEKNRDDYKWTEPHAKGYLVQTLNDSVADLIKKRAAQLEGDSLVRVLREEFAKQASIDKVLVSKGTNALVDYLVFGGPEAKSKTAKYTVAFMLDPRVITEPEEVADVKGLVTSDYQNEFQAAWENELRKKYPVTVNEKVLRSVKKTK